MQSTWQCEVCVSKAVFVAAGSQQHQVIQLKDPLIAGVLAWLVPGLGHLYQGRTAKGVLFMVCILSTFFTGLALSDGRAVYASWVDWDRRLYYYACQVGVGAPALPALLQAYLVREGKDPILGGMMAPPASPMELNEWHRALHHYFELGTVYTMIAGLLNILAIYDAVDGPVPLEDEEKKRDDKKSPGNEPVPSGA